MAIRENRNTVKDLLKAANEQIKTISVQEAQSHHGDQNFVYVDLRDAREIKRSGKIPEAFSCPRGMLEFWIDPDSPYHKEIFNEDKTFIFYRASGWRSALSTKTASEMGLEKTCHIEGGFTAWVKHNGEVENIE